MRSVLHRTMNFAYIEQGVPRVLTARVMVQFPLELHSSVQHVLGNIALLRHRLFVINDEDVEFQTGNLVTDHVSWKMSDRTLVSIPRAEKDPNNRSCICCAMADYFTRCMPAWLRNRKDAAELITLDVVLADHEDSQFIDDNATDMGALFFEASVYVLETSSNSWSNMGVFFTDQRKYDGATIFLKEKGASLISASHLQIHVADFDPYANNSSGTAVHDVLSNFTDRFGMFNGILTIKGV